MSRRSACRPAAIRSAPCTPARTNESRWSRRCATRSVRSPATMQARRTCGFPRGLAGHVIVETARQTHAQLIVLAVCPASPCCRDGQPVPPAQGRVPGDAHAGQRRRHRHWRQAVQARDRALNGETEAWSPPPPCSSSRSAARSRPGWTGCAGRRSIPGWSWAWVPPGSSMACPSPSPARLFDAIWVRRQNLSSAYDVRRGGYRHHLADPPVYFHLASPDLHFRCCTTPTRSASCAGQAGRSG
jgi:hypothetical protein